MMGEVTSVLMRVHVHGRVEFPFPFKNSLFIFESAKGLVCERDGELVYYLVDRFPETITIGGSMQLWITRDRHHRALVKGVLPEWSMSIDGSEMPRGLYNSFQVAGVDIRFSYKNYQFNCNFPGEKVDTSFIQPL